MDILTAYDNLRQRVSDLVTDLDAGLEARTVPSCPDFDVHDLVAHMAAMPVALANGNLPSGDIQAWLDGIVEDNRATSIADMVAAWADAAPQLAGVLASPLLAVDLCVHEHDLRATIDRPGARDSAELVALVPSVVESLAHYLTDAGLGAIEVRSEGHPAWRSHDAEPGWVLQVSPWEAVRALESRRTADELRALPGEGDPEPYISVLDAHLPLPGTSLDEV